MMSHPITRLMAISALCFLGSGCTQRHIVDAASHNSHNSYKVQTVSVYAGGYWVSSEVWSCHKDNGSFECTELEYDTSKTGISRPESAEAPAEEAPEEMVDTAPEEEADAEADGEAATEEGDES